MPTTLRAWGMGSGYNAYDSYNSGLDAIEMLQACFRAGTPLLTPEGSKPIERFVAGDLVLSRSEFDPEGPIEAKVVEEVFVRVSPIVNLHVAGKIIGTTAEHPFFVKARGWLSCRQLDIGDELLAADGEWLPVEGVAHSGEVTTVYNLRVADYHTYFVGGEDWGWSVWAHNASYSKRAISRIARKLDRRITIRSRTLRKISAHLQSGALGKALGKLKTVPLIGPTRALKIVTGLHQKVTANNPVGPAAQLSPQMEAKILYGEIRGSGTALKIVGGHSPGVGDIPLRELTHVRRNESGTRTSRLVGVTAAGQRTRVKGTGKTQHTLFPADWSDSQISQAVIDAGNQPYSVGPRPQDGATIHHLLRGGVFIEVAKAQTGQITAGYPIN